MHANLGITVLAKVNLTIMLIPHLKKKTIHEPVPMFIGENWPHRHKKSKEQ